MVCVGRDREVIDKDACQKRANFNLDLVILSEVSISQYMFTQETVQSILLRTGIRIQSNHEDLTTRCKTYINHIVLIC